MKHLKNFIKIIHSVEEGSLHVIERGSKYHNMFVLISHSHKDLAYILMFFWSEHASGGPVCNFIFKRLFNSKREFEMFDMSYT